MAQLWGGRFTKETDQLVYNFNASISFDKRFYAQDMKGSMAHVRMLAKQGILTEEERDQILDGLNGILKDVEEGRLEITSEYEDIHSFVEAVLIDRIGDAGKKMHTGRSRNDQVALDMKLYTRDEIKELNHLVKEMMEVLLEIMEAHLDTYMPGFTHLQKAQPITLAHHMGAYFEMFKRDHERLIDIAKRMNTCPLGSGALAGTTYPLDIAELVRGKTGRVYGALNSFLTTMKGIPLAYNKDMQEDKEWVFDAIDTTKGCLALFTGMLKTMQFNKERMAESARHGFTNATDAADYLVNHGVPFRDAHGIVGRLVLLCIEKKIALDDLPLDEYKEICPVFEEDIYEAISLKTCVNKRLTIGAPGHDAMAQVIKICQDYLSAYEDGVSE